MSREEDLIRSTTHAIASTVREVPPLRLEPAPDELRSPARAPRRTGGGSRQRRWWSWAAPLTAAAVVVALAIALVIIKDLPNGSAVPPTPSTSTGPGGIPRYYVVLRQLAGDVGSSTQRNDIVVGDSLTGKTIATFAPPARTAFESVTAADDDRTFVVFALTSSNGKFEVSAKDATLTGSWYEVRLTPGTADPARLTLLPIKPQTVPGSHEGIPLDAFTDSIGTVLSRSGQELAVPEWAAPYRLTVKVFSVATGQLLHDWTTNGTFSDPSLTWIDGDRELALGGSSVTVQPGSKSVVTNVTVHEWPVAEPDSGDLLADSKVVWDPRPAEGQVRFEYCFQQGGFDLISPDGKTISCAVGQAQSAGEILSFLTYPLTLSTTVAAEGRIDYEVTLPKEKGTYIPEVLWASPSGDTFIGALVPYLGSATAVANGLHIGVISHGKFTPLRLPPDLLSTGQQLQTDQIAF